MGSISGVRPTATAMAKKKAPLQSCLVKPLMRKTSGTITAMSRIMSQVKRLRPWSKLVGAWLLGDRAGHAAEIGVDAGGDHDRRRRAALDAGAHEADVVEFSRRADAVVSGSWNFSTGSDSPVRLPWLTKRSLDESTRTSPGIMSPAESLMMSPGTRSRSGISFASPSRSTVAVTWIMALSFAAAASARASCRKRSATLSTTMAAITVPARASPVAKEIDERVASRITSGLRTIFSRRMSQPCRRSCAISFGPAVRARLGLGLRQALRGCTQGLEQLIAVSRGGIEDCGLKHECSCASPLPESALRPGVSAARILPSLAPLSRGAFRS